MTLSTSSNMNRKIQLEYEKLTPKADKSSCLQSVFRYLSSIKLTDSDKALKIKASEDVEINWEHLFFRGIKD